MRKQSEGRFGFWDFPMVESSPRGSPSEEKHKIRLFLESLSGFEIVLSYLRWLKMIKTVKKW